jgi:hypothetical protein
MVPGLLASVKGCEFGFLPLSSIVTVALSIFARLAYPSLHHHFGHSE